MKLHRISLSAETLIVATIAFLLIFANHAFWQRTVGAFQNDSNSKALLSFFTLASSVSSSLDAQLGKIQLQFNLLSSKLDLNRLGAVRFW